MPSIANAALASVLAGCAPHRSAPNEAHGLPLALVADVDLPGGATRFDYQDLDATDGHLIIAHMDDGTVLINSLADGSVVSEVAGVPTARGVVVASDAGRIFVTCSPNHVVIIDATSLAIVGRVDSGAGPDGLGWDPADQTLGVSDQRDGALSLIADAGSGARRVIPVGQETGNVVFDAVRGWFWITAVQGTGPDHLVAVDPRTGAVTQTLDVPGCVGAHGLRLHPDGQSAFIACEGNDRLARVDLGGSHEVTLGPTGAGPDVLAIDPALGLLYVAAESGDLTVFDLHQSGVVRVDEEHPGENAHTVAVDPANHRVFFPLERGPHGTPVLRIMQPSDLPQ